MSELDLNAYAKINLALDIEGKRPDGYHQVKTVMQRIGLHDKVRVKWTAGGEPGITVQTASDRDYLPEGGVDITQKAAELLICRYDVYEKTGPGRVRIDIEKQIPVAAGLGGGSADGAAVLHALSEIWGLGLTPEELMKLGAEIGADVPFNVMGHTGNTCALATGTGTELTPMPGLASFIVLSKPAVSVSTASAYAGFDRMGDTGFKRPNVEALLAAMKDNDLAAAAENMINVFENYILPAYPLVEAIREKMMGGTSPVKVLMSGSGPTIVGFYKGEADALAAYEKMAAVNEETFLTETQV